MTTKIVLIICFVINEIDFDNNEILFIDDSSYRLKNCLIIEIILRFEIRSSKILTNRRNNEMLIC